MELVRKWLDKRTKPKIDIDEVFDLIDSIDDSNWQTVKQKLMSLKQ